MISDKEARQYILQKLYEGGYRYLARDESAFLYAHRDRPKKKSNIWGGLDYVPFCIHIYSFSCFKDIKWVDSEPLDIAKELGIIDWTKIPKDTKVLVWDGEDARKEKRYFSHYVASDTNFPFRVYCAGATSWSTTVETVGYQCCELINGVEEQDHD